MTIGKGLKVELFASEKEFPELVNPVQMAFDTKGRLWVAAWKNYPHWQPKTPMDDKLLILEDTNGDGKADKRTVFAGDLQQPDRLRVLQRRRASSRSSRTWCSSRTPTATTATTPRRSSCTASTRPTRTTPSTASRSIRAARSTCRKASSIARRSNRRGGRRLRQADGGVYRFEPRTWKFETYVPMNFPNPHGHVFD